MGYYYAELIAPSILLDNPGVTAREFSDKLPKEVFYTTIPPEVIYALPHLLALPTKKSFKEYQRQQKIDSQGLPLSAPIVNLMEKPYKVMLQVGNELLPPKIHKNIEMKEISENQLTYLNGDDYWYVDQMCLVKQILNKTRIKLSSDHPFYREGDEYDNEVFEYEFICQEINEIFEEQFFDSEEDLFREYPQFKPENRFDFSIPNGVFLSMNILGRNFRWKQIDGRYFFDERSFDLMPAGSPDVRRQGVGYTDLIITSEVIRNGRCDLLGYRARDEGEEQLQSFVENLSEISRMRVETAIWDAHMSIYAKENGLSYFDMLHLRAPHDP